MLGLVGMGCESECAHWHHPTDRTVEAKGRAYEAGTTEKDTGRLKQFSYLYLLGNCAYVCIVLDMSVCV